MKKNIFILGIISIIIFLVFTISYKQQSKKNPQKIQIVTTLFPLYDFAKHIGKDKVEVSLLLPPGVEAHSFEPKPSDIATINQADIFIYTGKFMEPWAEDIIKGLTGENITVVDSSSGINLMKEEEHESEHANEHEEEHGHEHEGVDPHIWLDFDNDQKIIQTITTALSEKDPANTASYQKNADEYQKKLVSLDEEYKKTLAQCKMKEIVYGGHYAFGYLANRYGLTYLAAQGVSPDAEPTAQDLIQLVEQIKKDDIKYVFYEELTSPKIAETLANETKTQLLLLNAAHNVSKENFEKNVSFLSIMEDNLINLKIGLQCMK